MLLALNTYKLSSADSLDGAKQVATNIVTLNLLGSHPLSRILHNIVITFLLTEIHR
jgi:hypothetical protein